MDPFGEKIDAPYMIYRLYIVHCTLLYDLSCTKYTACPDQFQVLTMLEQIYRENVKLDKLQWDRYLNILISFLDIFLH